MIGWEGSSSSAASDRRLHAAGRRGHGKDFKALAVQLGLTGPMTATVGSPELLDFINWTLLPQLGQYPHGATRPLTLAPAAA